MNFIKNHINYKYYYQDYLNKHPKYAESAIGFVPTGPDTIKIYLDGGDYIDWNFVYDKSDYVSTDNVNIHVRKVGRPKSRRPLTERLTVRISANDRARLEEITERTGKTAADIFRKALVQEYKEVTSNDYDPADFYDDAF